MSDSAEPSLAMAGLELAAAPLAAGGAYRVLARKYRPQNFAQLIGQDAMVQTLANGIARNRLAHAFVLTGVRGVGKTSTARLIAKALNCIGPDGQGGPTIDPCGVCANCVAIAEGRHIDVIEMDAASHTGIDDVREIIEAVRYAAVSARTKLYIIDEAHMLSKPAWNGLLKTLEEPPPHVKFLFATTEVARVPVTVLSRCQRFDLRRITPAMLFSHFGAVLAAEAVRAEPEAVWLIAHAAEGSVRDGLSMLDQAIAQAGQAGPGSDPGGDPGGDDGACAITADAVRAMLGLSDRMGARKLLSALLAGDGAGAIALARAAHAQGSEPAALVQALMQLVHAISMAKVARLDDPALDAEAAADIKDLAARLGVAQLSRLWQLLAQGHDEVGRAAAASDHLDMLLLRIAFAATMPDPGELARLLAERSDPPAALPPLSPPAPAATPASALALAPDATLAPAAPPPPPAAAPTAASAATAPDAMLVAAQAAFPGARLAPGNPSPPAAIADALAARDGPDFTAPAPSAGPTTGNAP